MTTVAKATSLRALPPAEPVLEVRNLSKWYGRTQALSALSLTVQPGEIIGFVGPNGAGKSTTLRILMGLVRPSGGTASMCGRSLLNGSPQVRQNVGYLPGSPALYPRLTAKECLHFLQRVRRVDCRERVAELASRLDVDLDKHIHDLSRGNKQKVAFIAALMHSPRLLLLDEPTSGLDPIVQREVEKVLREQASAGVGILLSSHVLSEVEALADSVVMLHRGKTLLTAAMSDITSRLVQRLTFEFSTAADAQWFRGINGVTSVEVHARHADVTIDGAQAHALEAAVEHGVVNVHSHEQRLEDVFTELIPERAA